MSDKYFPDIEEEIKKADDAIEKGTGKIKNKSISKGAELAIKGFVRGGELHHLNENMIGIMIF